MKTIKELYFNRNPYSIKSDFGKTLIIAGSKMYPGAAFIAALFAQLSGVGYVALAVPNSIYEAAINNVSFNVIHEIISEDDNFIFNEKIKKYDSVLFGNGVQINEYNRKFLNELLWHIDNLIIDASGITLLSKNLAMLNRNKENNILLTPHIGELKQLLNLESDSRNPDDYLQLTKDFCLKYKVNILIKSYKSILVMKNGSIYHSEYEPTPALSRAGSGDALAGYIAGLLAYGSRELGYPKLIIYADDLIHQAAYNYSRKNSDGLLNAKALAEALKEEILNI